MQEVEAEATAWQIQDILRELEACNGTNNGIHDIVSLDDEEEEERAITSLGRHQDPSSISQVRSCLRRLDRILDGITEAYQNYHHNKNTTRDEDTDHDDDFSQEDTAALELSIPLRTALLDLMTRMDLFGLGTDGGGGSMEEDLLVGRSGTNSSCIRELYHQLCLDANRCLLEYALPHRELQYDEAAVVLSRILTLVLSMVNQLQQQQVGQLFFLENSNREELDILAMLLGLINTSLTMQQESRGVFQDTTYSHQSGDTNLENSIGGSSLPTENGVLVSGSSTTSQIAPAAPCLEALLGEPVHVTEQLKLLLPVATSCLVFPHNREGNNTSRVRSQLLEFTDYLLQHVSHSIDTDVRGSSLDEWVKMEIIENENDGDGITSAQADGITNEVLQMMHRYTTEFREYAFDLFDTATNAIQKLSQSRDDDDTHNSQHSSSDEEALRIMYETATYSRFLCNSLHLIRRGRHTTSAMDSLPTKTVSTRSLWIAYTKFFLASNTGIGTTGEFVEFSTETLVKLGLLAVVGGIHKEDVASDRQSGNAGNNVTLLVLDHEMQHAVSVTLLAALDYPELLLENLALVTAIAKLAPENGELRHLVQGVALHAILLPTVGASRNPDAMDKIIPTLVKIGMSSIHDSPQSDDPWDRFFQDQITKISIAQRE